MSRRKSGINGTEMKQYFFEEADRSVQACDGAFEVKACKRRSSEKSEKIRKKKRRK